MYPSQQAERFQVRLPDGLRERLKEVAQENRRSMNAEIVFHLERALFDRMEMKKGGEVSA
ncbi:Arc family DNA-binding protein [Rhizobium leguminosarum]|uniref:Arc family DNA-binding protein n=1 Tax=Rhizobium leguminosarum TaxID=384 RepID=UPI0010318FB1|nr:Arc family DNA-binding protein [Rhizobium leguminosarum]TAY68440.1 Arc family DNA-binding protein [Rhizobium leguminosarum]